MRIVLSSLLCTLFPGWGVCALLCSAMTMAAQSPACCADVSAAATCCSSEGHAGCAKPGNGCACAHDAVPAHPVHAPDVPLFEGAAQQTLDTPFYASLADASPQASAQPITARTLLQLHQRLNL